MRFVLLVLILLSIVLISGCLQPPKTIIPITPVAPPVQTRLLPAPCEEVIPGHNSLNSATRINVVFVDIEQKIEDFRYVVNASLDYNQEAFGLLNLEPLKSNKNKFNFWYVDKIGKTLNGVCDYNSLECSNLARTLSADCKINNKYTIALVNKTQVASGWANNDVAISLTSIDATKEILLRVYGYNWDPKNPSRFDCTVYDQIGDKCIDMQDLTKVYQNNLAKPKTLELDSCLRAAAGACLEIPLYSDLSHFNNII